MALIISKSVLARRRRVDPSAVSKAIRPGGALHAALLPAGRIDRAHPAVLKWLGDPHLHDPAISAEGLARIAGVSVDEIRRSIQSGGELEPAAIPSSHVSVSAFATLSGIPVPVVFSHLENGSLKGAVTKTRRIDITHPAALALFARHPFKRDAKGDPVAPDFDLSPACVGDEIDADHPVARVFLARCLGRMPTAADMGAGE